MLHYKLPIITLPLVERGSSVNLVDGTHKTRRKHLPNEH
jgi:hypothetical protein